MSAVLEPTPKSADRAAFELNKLSKRLHRQVGQAILPGGLSLKTHLPEP